MGRPSVDRCPEIFPVNYAVDRETLIFRTAEGTKLLAMVVNPSVAFEVDGYDPQAARRAGGPASSRQIIAHRDANSRAVVVGPSRVCGSDRSSVGICINRPSIDP